ncbi:MAG: peptidyl-prolyl cis-trans isomerase [Ignavibacteriae bacterium]|nr:peptidyl-prolyl cis-trans isomerase [Ignavibacteriota bacterium]
MSDRAKDFSYNAKENEFVAEALSTGLEVREAEIQEKGGVIPGIGFNESITRWAFKNKVGAVSEPYSIPSGYAVFTIVEAKDASVRPFDDVKESLRPLVLRKKKMDQTKEIAAGLKAKLAPSDSLKKLEEMNSSLRVQRTGPFALGASVPGVGRDMNFIGAVSGLSPGEFSPPIQSLRGIYLIQLVSSTQFDSTAFAAQRDVIRNQMLQEKRNRFMSDWIAKLKENADIEDNRDLFFR